MIRKLSDAAAESAHRNMTVTVEVEDTSAAYLDLLGSDYEIDSETRETENGSPCLLVCGWTGDGNAHDEAEWSLRLVGKG